MKWPVSRDKRDAMIRLSGQRVYPVIERDDGRIYREQSKDMATRIRAGELDEAPARRPGSRATATGSEGA